MAAGSYNTMVEWLNKINADLASAMTCPDADIAFLSDIQTKVLQKLRAPYDSNPNGPAAQLPPAGGGAPPGGPGGGPPPELAALLGGGPGPGGGAPMMGPPPGHMPMARPAPPSPDEMQRLMAG